MKNKNKPKEDERQRVGKQLSFALYGATSRMVRSHRPFLEPLGLTFPQFLVMVTLYEKLAEEISLQIRTGVLRAGDRIPSVRQFSRARGLSSNTVLQAYHLLEDRGEIRALLRSGYFVMPRRAADAAVEAAVLCARKRRAPRI